jgi:hypothetical protein
MALVLLSKDEFPLLVVANWASKAEAHETLTVACCRERLS